MRARQIGPWTQGPNRLAEHPAEVPGHDSEGKDRQAQVTEPVPARVVAQMSPLRVPGSSSTAYGVFAGRTANPASRIPAQDGTGPLATDSATP